MPYDEMTERVDDTQQYCVNHRWFTGWRPVAPPPSRVLPPSLPLAGPEDPARSLVSMVENLT